MSDTYTSSSYYYSSSDGSTATGHRYTTTSHTEPDGTTIVRTARQDLGQPAVVEERRYDRTGQEQLSLDGPGGSSAGGARRITEVDEDGAQVPDDDGVDRGSWDLSTTPFGMRLFDRATGAYDEHEDYRSDGGIRHHREVRDVSGRRFRRDLEFGAAGSTSGREHTEFENPETGRR